MRQTLLTTKPNSDTVFQLPTSSTSPRYAIVGGGISGLTAAFRLTQLVPNASVEVFEASERLGGMLCTSQEDGYLVEHGADSFLKKLPWAVELCEELGIAGDLLPTNPVGRRALVVRDGSLHPVPEGFVVLKPHRMLPMLLTPLLSWRGKLRLLRERWIASPKELAEADYDESVASFATRRLGRETFERLVQPLLAGIYTADPTRLSLAATMPDAIEAEREHGSITRAILHQANQKIPPGEKDDSQESGVRYASFVTPRNGLSQMIDALAKRLTAENLHLNTLVQSVTKNENQQWVVQNKDGTAHEPYDGVIVAIPAPSAAQLMEPVDTELGCLLQKITYASSAIVCMLFRRDQIAHDLDGFGFVVPAVEGSDLIAASFSSVKFPGRAPDDQVLIRIFFGGALQAELVDLPDEKLQSMARSGLDDLLGVTGEPLKVDVVRWREKMPQYHVGHVQLVDSIEQRVADLEGLELAGNAYRGVGIPQCVRSGNEAAHRLVASIID